MTQISKERGKSKETTEEKESQEKRGGIRKEKESEGREKRARDETAAWKDD